MRRQFDTSLYEQLALSRDKEGVERLGSTGQDVIRPQDLLKNPYVLEFLGLNEKAHYSDYPKTGTAGRDAGKTKYYLNSFIPFSSGNEEVQVYVEDENISMHIRNIYDEGELQLEVTVKKFLTVRREGNRDVQRHIEY